MNIKIVTILLLMFGLTVNVISNSINVFYGKFTDNSRNRIIPYKLYSPKNLKNRLPVIIFSHGLGGSVEAAKYLSSYLAQNNYIVFNIQHHGSDCELWKGKAFTRFGIIPILKKSLKNPYNAINRFKDIPFVIDKIIAFNKKSTILKNHIDTNNIGIAGHSYGSVSVITAVGKTIPFLGSIFKDPRIKCGIMLSPPKLEKRIFFNPYKNISVPLFHITGTKDTSPIQPDLSADNRAELYDYLKIHNQFLLILNNADHMAFSGTNTLKYKHYHDIVKKGALLFFNSFLKNNIKDLLILKNNFKKVLSKNDIFKWK